MARYRKPTTDALDFDTDEDTAGPRLSPAVQAQLGHRLRAFYEALALGEQPVPDRFIEIINRLDQGQPGSGQEKRS
jgi:Anti-sigma factor NepR